MSDHPKILFLYTELAGYSIACLHALASMGAEVHVVRRPVNSEAPFVFQQGSKIFYYERESLSRAALLKIAETINPSLIIVSGWVDKDYLYIARKFKDRAGRVLAFDNQWNASLRQRAASLIGRLSFLRYFNYAWVPGKRQAEFAKRLGFSESEIHLGFYACDISLYNSYFNSSLPGKSKHFPKRFVFVGRYYEFKGVRDLWQAFVELQQEEQCQWELWCLGTGDIQPLNHPGIKHFGFVQPDQMEQIIRQSGVFILPSHFEPWGVAVQEFAAAGFPLLCSNQVGATNAFLQVGINGYIYKAGDVNDLKDKMRKFTKLTDEELLKMGNRSHQNASCLSPVSWASEAMSMAQNTKVL